MMTIINQRRKELGKRNKELSSWDSNTRSEPDFSASSEFPAICLAFTILCETFVLIQP